MSWRGGGEGGGLVCEEKNGRNPPIFYFFFQLQPHTHNSNTQSTFNPRMYDEGTVVISIFPKHIFCPLQTQTHDICYLYYQVVAIHILSKCISTSANHIFNEVDTSWPAGCWRITSQ